MSVFLLVLRLEVADRCTKSEFPNLEYNAKHFKISPPESEKTYADATSGTKPVISEESFNRNRGRREFTPITIETYIPENMGDTHEDQEEGMAVDTETKKDTQEEKVPVVDHRPKVKDQAGVTGDRKRLLSADDSAAASTSHGEGESEGDGGAGPGSAGLKSRSKSHSPTSQHPQTIRFFSGNPAVETTEGIIHIYKDSSMTPLSAEVPRSELICILTVPASMTSQDLLQFVGPVAPWVESMKIIRDGMPNKYMVLVKFKNQTFADDFYKDFNNKPFNMIEPETCHLVYVAKVESIKEGEGASLPVAGLTELPVCPVCLERMDESVDGILTILCNHTFHGSCLAQWGDTSCPVCRYVQTPEPVEDQKCFECDSQDSLWICLICGHVGCGRYVGGHAYRHFQDTQHCYSMQLGNNRVWDYAGDNYVHRLIQNKGDGKLVEVDEGGNIVQDEKLDSITLEYTYLLTSQLESQRRFFEERIEHIEKEALKQVEDVEHKSKAALEQCSRLEQKLSLSQKEKQTHERKVQQLQTKVQKLGTDLTEEREMNKCLTKNQSQWQKKVADMERRLEEKDKEVKDLQEQLRDIMFYLEAQQKIAKESNETQQEIQEGHIVVGAPSASHSGKKGRKKGR